jgi:hypothetical protein
LGAGVRAGKAERALRICMPRMDGFILRSTAPDNILSDQEHASDFDVFGCTGPWTKDPRDPDPVITLLKHLSNDESARLLREAAVLSP